MFKMVPVEGERNVYIIQAGPLETSTGGEMTEADWDKFERDINDACEQID